MSEKCIMLLFILFLIIVFTATYLKYKDCSDKGGVLVRGAVKFECIKIIE